MTHKIDSTATVLVATDFYWREIDAATPLGLKLLLINQTAGVATLGQLVNRGGYWTHWASLPVFKDRRE